MAVRDTSKQTNKLQLKANYKVVFSVYNNRIFSTSYLEGHYDAVDDGHLAAKGDHVTNIQLETEEAAIHLTQSVVILWKRNRGI